MSISASDILDAVSPVGAVIAGVTAVPGGSLYPVTHVSVLYAFTLYEYDSPSHRSVSVYSSVFGASGAISE